MSRGIIQNAIENKSVIMWVELGDFSGFETKFESEEPTLADLTVPGTGRSISAEGECLLGSASVNGKS